MNANSEHRSSIPDCWICIERGAGLGQNYTLDFRIGYATRMRRMIHHPGLQSFSRISDFRVGISLAVDLTGHCTLWGYYQRNHSNRDRHKKIVGNSRDIGWGKILDAADGRKRIMRSVMPGYLWCGAGF
jgi:hypothetical protein